MIKHLAMDIGMILKNQPGNTMGEDAACEGCKNKSI
jgi:hypothetical protein